jgi:protein-disulfide isomerase
VRIVWKNNPLPFHPFAMPSALASMAAYEQGKFWEYHDKLFANQQKLTRDDLLRYAKEVGLDLGRFEAALNSARGKPLIDADVAEAKSLGASGTPAFFVNGRFLSGARPFDDFAQLINAELTRLKIPVPPPPPPAPPATAPSGKSGRS